MEIKDIEVYANKIDLGCCEHERRQYKYFLGYVGFKCCKVAMCLDCEKTQFVGKSWAKPIYLLSRKLFRNRLEVLKMIYIDMVGENGMDLDGVCVICGKKIPVESGKQYCFACEKEYLSEVTKDYGNETKSEK